MLLFAAPNVPLAQPRNLVGGHVLAALAGWVCYEAVSRPMGDPVIAAPLAVSTAIMGMLATRTLHPPAGGTALIFVLGSDAVHDMGPLWAAIPILTSALLMLVVALFGNNMAFSERSYPNYWL